MKITIDTKEDSQDEIRGVIKMLSSIVGQEVFSNQGDLFGDNAQQTQSSDIFSDDTPQIQDSGDSTNNQTESPNIFSMFGNDSGSTTSPEGTTEDNSEEKKKDDELDIDIPDVEEYH